MTAKLLTPRREEPPPLAATIPEVGELEEDVNRPTHPKTLAEESDGGCCCCCCSEDVLLPRDCRDLKALEEDEEEEEGCCR